MDEDAAAGCSVFMGIAGIIVFVITIFTGGIWRTEVAYSPQDVSELAVQTTYTEDFTARHYLFALVMGKQPDLRASLAEHLGSGREISKIKITTRHSAINNLIMGVTLGIYCPVTVSVEATINQAPETSSK